MNVENTYTQTSTRASKGQGPYGLFYASQVEQIKDRLGDLEGIRKNLKMSRRQICQILLVNPSAWTRWTKSKKGAPPHFYRALEWLISIYSQQTHQNKSLDSSHSTDLANQNPQESQDKKDIQTETHQPIYWKQNRFNNIDFIENHKTPLISHSTSKNSNEMKILKRQIFILKWLVIVLCGFLIFLSMRLFTKGLLF